MAVAADRPANKKSNMVLRGLHLLVQPIGCSTVGNLTRIPRIGRERRQVLVNSAHVRADTHACNGAGGGWWKEVKAGVVARKLLLLI